MSRQPEPWPSSRRRTEKVEKELRRIGASSPFFGTGVHPNGQQGLDSDNYEPGVAGFSFQGDTGNAEFNQLTLRAGIVGDDALANLIKFEYTFGRATGFGLGTSWALLASNTLVVPAGMTRAAISLNAGMFAYNPNTTGGSNGQGGDAWNIYCGSVGGYGSDTFPIGVSGLGGFASAHANVAYSLNVTGGSSITFGVWGASSYQSVAANPNNHASVSGTVTWYR